MLLMNGKRSYIVYIFTMILLFGFSENKRGSSYELKTMSMIMIQQHYRIMCPKIESGQNGPEDLPVL